MSLVLYLNSDGINQTPVSVATPLPVTDAAVVAAIVALAASMGSVVVAPTGGTLTSATSGSIYTNEGASAIAAFVLPGAAAGTRYTFIVQDADGIRVTAAAGDTIGLAGNVSAAAGKIESTTLGSSVTIVAINATEWVATSIVGTWTVT